MTLEEIIERNKLRRIRAMDNTIPHEKIEISKELFSCIQEAFDAFFDMGEDTEWEKMSQQDFYYVCKVCDWMQYAKQGISGTYEQTDQEFFSTIVDICENEDYTPPRDALWEEMEEGDL